MTSAQARKTRMGISPGWLPLAIQTLCVHRRSLRLFTIPTLQGEGGERMERSCLTSPSYHCCELSRAAIDSTVEDNHAQNHKADHNAEECEGVGGLGGNPRRSCSPGCAKISNLRCGFTQLYARLSSLVPNRRGRWTGGYPVINPTPYGRVGGLSAPAFVVNRSFRAEGKTIRIECRGL